MGQTDCITYTDSGHVRRDAGRMLRWIIVFILGAMVFGLNGKRMVVTCFFGVENNAMMYDTMIVCY